MSNRQNLCHYAATQIRSITKYVFMKSGLFKEKCQYKIKCVLVILYYTPTRPLNESKGGRDVTFSLIILWPSDKQTLAVVTVDFVQ